MLANIVYEETHGALKTPYIGDRAQNTIHVLHVDDETNQLILTKRFLEDADSAIQIESSPSPKEALQMLEHGSFDCIISDYAMAEMDGISLARLIREESRIPFILFTGKGSEEVESEAFAAGVDDYLIKEIDPSHFRVLAKHVRMVVEKYRAEDAQA
jgi:CheY-like chemotaxis protein